MKTNSRMIVLLMTMVNAEFVYGQTNALPNGDFSAERQLSGWTALGTGSVGFNSNVDADNSPSSGIMSLGYRDTDHPERAVSTCFPVQGGAAFRFGGKYVGYNVVEVDAVAKMTCSSFSDTSCSSGGTNLGFANLDDLTHISANPKFISWIPVDGRLDAKAEAAQCTVSTVETFNGFPDMSQGSGASVDDLYFTVDPAPVPVKLGGYLSGSWYDPTQSGQGFELEFAAQGNALIATWLTFASDGSGRTEWIYGGGIWDPSLSTATVSAFVSSGAVFPPNFVATNVKRTLWGDLTFSFTDCNHATVQWSSVLPGYESGSQQLTRLTSIAGLSCPQ